MKQLLSLLALVLATLISVSASAGECLAGDAPMGPNCVHVEERSARLPMTTVYQVKDDRASTVWMGLGTVKKSTKSYLIIEELVGTPDGRLSTELVKHNWTGTVYEP